MKPFLWIPLAFVCGAALPATVTAPFVTNCEVIIRPPTPPGTYTDVALSTSEEAITANIEVHGEGLVRLRKPDTDFFVDDESGEDVSEALQPEATTRLTYTASGDSRIIASGQINGRKIREETFQVSPRPENAKLLTRIGEDSSGGGRSAVRFHHYGRTVKFLLEDVAGADE